MLTRKQIMKSLALEAHMSNLPYNPTPNASSFSRPKKGIEQYFLCGYTDENGQFDLTYIHKDALNFFTKKSEDPTYYAHFCDFKQKRMILVYDPKKSNPENLYELKVDCPDFLPLDDKSLSELHKLLLEGKLE